MPRASRPCSEPGCPAVAGPRGRCPQHQAEREQYEKATVPTKVSGARWSERQRRATTVRQHRENRGDWCPGYGRPPHPSTDLTADHIVAQADGGAADGPLTVLCRSCNSRKNAQVKRH